MAHLNSPEPIPAFRCAGRDPEAAPEIPLVMHGSSSVPQEEVERINKAGGKLQGAKGVDANQFRTPQN